MPRCLPFPHDGAERRCSRKDRRGRRRLRAEAGLGASSDHAAGHPVPRDGRAGPPAFPLAKPLCRVPEEQQAEEGWYLDLLEWETGLLWQQIALTL